MKNIYITGLDKSGKSMVSAGIGTYLSKDKSVTLVDMSSGNRNLENALGMGDYIVYDIYDYLSSMCDMEQVLLDVDENIFLIPSSYKKDKYIPRNEDFIRLNNEISSDYIVFKSSNIGDIDVLLEIVDTFIYVDNGVEFIEDFPHEKIESMDKFVISTMDTGKSSHMISSLLNKGFKYAGNIPYMAEDRDKFNKGTKCNYQEENNVFENLVLGKNVPIKKKNIFQRIFGIK